MPKRGANKLYRSIEFRILILVSFSSIKGPNSKTLNLLTPKFRMIVALTISKLYVLLSDELKLVNPLNKRKLNADLVIVIECRIESSE